jgi:aspartate/methionine/tyrosine aminotransferase
VSGVAWSVCTPGRWKVGEASNQRLLSGQVGWVTGPAALLAPVIKAHQFLVFTVPSNLQRAVAYGLDEQAAFYKCVAVMVWRWKVSCESQQRRR